jgi:uncharacterized protein with HEPN domain
MPPDARSPTPDDRARIEHMLRAARDAVIALGHMDAELLAKDMIRGRALTNCFAEIGEAAARLSPAGRELVGPFPWRQIVAMRNIVVHVYWGIDLGKVVATVREDLPLLIPALEASLKA